jgi:hypothetical protein
MHKSIAMIVGVLIIKGQAWEDLCSPAPRWFEYARRRHASSKKVVLVCPDQITWQASTKGGESLKRSRVTISWCLLVEIDELRGI